MSVTAQLGGLLQSLRSVKSAQLEWWMTNVASPAAPLAWFANIQPAGPAGRWLLGTVKWTTVILWAAGFVWLWFPLFWILLLWETFLARE